MKAKNEAKPSQTQRPVLSIFKARAVTPIIYGRSIDQLPASMQELIRKAYGDEVFAHIDYVLPRAPHPITGELMLYIPGTTVYSALKVAAGMAGKPFTMPSKVLGLYFPQSLASINIYHVQKDKSIPVVAEVVNPGEGQLLILGDQIPDAIKVSPISVGRWRKRGFGLVQIDW